MAESEGEEITKEERDKIKALVAEQMRNDEQRYQQERIVLRELAARGWIEGATFDYQVSEDLGVKLRAKNGVVVNALLPEDWRYMFKEDGASSTEARFKRINIDPRIEAAKPEGMAIVVHETGHAIIDESMTADAVMDSTE